MAVDTPTKQASIINAGTPWPVMLPWEDASALDQEEQQHFLNLFSDPPAQLIGVPDPATDPSPADLATGVSVDADLSWTPGLGATSHDVYFGTTNPPGAPEFKGNQAGTTYEPGTLAFSTEYFWRIDEKNAAGTTTGDVWSFTTEALPAPGQASNPNPANVATNVSISADLSWSAGSNAETHDVYFGTNPTPGPAEFQGNQAGTTFDPGSLAFGVTYFWRIDEVNATDTTTGIIWSFTTQNELPSGDPDTGYQPSGRFATSGDSMTMFPWKK